MGLILEGIHLFCKTWYLNNYEIVPVAIDDCCL